MTTQMQIDKMSREEKLQAMEAIWIDLSNDDESIVSPYWHEDELKDTEIRLSSGKEQIHDWTTAKRELRKRFE